MATTHALLTTSNRRSARRQRRARRGAALVEFALTCPLLITFVFASIEMARVNMLRHMVADAAYEGARTGTVPGSTAAQMAATATAMLGSVSAQGYTITVSPTAITTQTTSVTVTITLPLAQNGWIAPIFFKGKSLTNTCTLQRDVFEVSTVP